MACAWALLQLIGFVADTFDWPCQIQQFASIGLAVGLPVVSMVAWCHGDHGQQRLFELLGSSADRKKQVLFESGHGKLPRFQVEKEALDWFERHLSTADR